MLGSGTARNRGRAPPGYVLAFAFLHRHRVNTLGRIRLGVIGRNPLGVLFDVLVLDWLLADQHVVRQVIVSSCAGLGLSGIRVAVRRRLRGILMRRRQSEILAPGARWRDIFER